MSLQILSTQFSSTFCLQAAIPSEVVELMQNRMLVSYYKYGDLRQAYPHKVHAIESGIARVEKYKKTHNLEWLVDALNFFMIESMATAHPDFHYKDVDDLIQDCAVKLPLQQYEVELSRYAETGNLFYLLSAAKEILAEYKNPSYTDAYFEGTDSNQSIGRVAYDSNFELTVKDNKELTANEWNSLHT